MGTQRETPQPNPLVVTPQRTAYPCARRSYSVVLNDATSRLAGAAVPFVAVGGNRFLSPAPPSHDDDATASMRGLGRARVTLVEVGAGGCRHLVRGRHPHPSPSKHGDMRCARCCVPTHG
jgi:hypothetical protein